jgi:MFS family permease
MYWAGLASAGLSLIAFFGTVLLLPESLPVESRKPLKQVVVEGKASAPSASLFDSLRARPVLLGLMTASLLVGVAGAAMQSVFQFWGRDLFDYSLRDVGLHFAAFALLSAVGQAGLVGPLAKRFGEKHVAVGSIIGVTIGLGLFAVAQSDAMVWVAISVFGLANGLFLPSIGRILGPAISGPLYFKLGPAAPFVFSAASTALGALMLSRARARKSDEAN